MMRPRFLRYPLLFVLLVNSRGGIFMSAAITSRLPYTDGLSASHSIYNARSANLGLNAILSFTFSNLIGRLHPYPSDGRPIEQQRLSNQAFSTHKS